VSLWIPLLRMHVSYPFNSLVERVEANVYVYMCGYCKYSNEMCYKAPVIGVFVMF